MEIKRLDLLWSICLLIIGIVSIILFGSTVIGKQLPDLIRRILGIIDIIALPVFSFCSIKRIKLSK